MPLQLTGVEMVVERTNAVKFAKACPECAMAMGTGRKGNPTLHPIPVQHPFHILGIDIMDLPQTERGNKHVVVIQGLFTEWPLVFAVPDQKILPNRQTLGGRSCPTLLGARGPPFGHGY